MIIDTDCVVIVKVRCSLVTKIFIARIFGRDDADDLGPWKGYRNENEKKKWSQQGSRLNQRIVEKNKGTVCICTYVPIGIYNNNSLFDVLLILFPHTLYITPSLINIHYEANFLYYYYYSINYCFAKFNLNGCVSFKRCDFKTDKA